MDLLLVLVVAGLATAAAMPAVLESLRAYQRTGAARMVLAKIRETQHAAITRRDVFGFHWGGDPAVSKTPAEFRIVRDTSGACGFPAESAPRDDVDVLQAWADLSTSFQGIRIDSVRDNDGDLLGGVMFDSRGFSVNTCTSASFPVRVTVSDSAGNSRVIEIRNAGGTRLL